MFAVASVTAVAQATGGEYILTPKPGPEPRINGAKVFGVSPGAPVMYKIASTGEKPLRYRVSNHPDGIYIDENTGILSGSIAEPGTYVLKATVSNRYGKAKADIRLVVGDVLSLTPPMGWNSWYNWGLTVTQERVMASAQAMIDKGLVDFGWSYVNIDDGWEAYERLPDGTLLANEKFPDMKGLSDWIHSNGMKFGIYSSPGPTTCGGYLGSYGHEQQDADVWGEWEVDFVKYDLCSYKWEIQDKQSDTTIQRWIKPFRKMREALDRQPRDMVYLVCSYESIPWIDSVGGNMTRLSADIKDSWKNLLNNGFDMEEYAPYQRPGRWNDPDMLVIGSIDGWNGERLRKTGLTPDEQYTHISLWCLYSAPLLIGCDIAHMDDFTLGLLTNAEMIDINQDPLGKQAVQVISKNDYKVFVKEMEDGSHAVGIFNISDAEREITVNWSELGIKGGKVRDPWRQRDLGKFPVSFSAAVAAHGVQMIRIFE